jgi:hypothetical protein
VTDPDLQTVFLTHEIEHGMNPELNIDLWARIYRSDCD